MAAAAGFGGAGHELAAHSPPFTLGEPFAIGNGRWCFGSMVGVVAINGRCPRRQPAHAHHPRRDGGRYDPGLAAQRPSVVATYLWHCHAAVCGGTDLAARGAICSWNPGGPGAIGAGAVGAAAAAASLLFVRRAGPAGAGSPGRAG